MSAFRYFGRRFLELLLLLLLSSLVIHEVGESPVQGSEFKDEAPLGYTIGGFGLGTPLEEVLQKKGPWLKSYPDHYRWVDLEVRINDDKELTWILGWSLERSGAALLERGDYDSDRILKLGEVPLELLPKSDESLERYRYGYHGTDLLYQYDRRGTQLSVWMGSRGLFVFGSERVRCFVLSEEPTNFDEIDMGYW